MATKPKQPDAEIFTVRIGFQFGDPEVRVEPGDEISSAELESHVASATIASLLALGAITPKKGVASGS